MTYTSTYSPYTKDGGASSAALMAATLLLLAIAVLSVLWAYSSSPGIPDTGGASGEELMREQTVE